MPARVNSGKEAGMHVTDIQATVSRVKAVSVGFGGFIGRHKRLSIAVVVALLLAGPLVTGDGELVFLNAVGLGFGALLLRRFIKSGGRQRTGRTQQAQRQPKAKATQHEATVLKVKKNDRRPSELGHARASHA